MATQTDFGADEWKAIVGAPVAAGLLITMADVSGPVGIAKEAMAVSKAIAETSTTASVDVVKAIGESVKAAGRLETPALPSDKTAVKAALIDIVRRGVAAVAAKSPGEADGYKRFVLEVAKKSAEASKEGGFLGIGGTQVSDAESAALKELSAALGVTA